MDFIVHFIESLGFSHPATYFGLFLAASLFMVWRLEAMGDHGLEGTALGTLVMPYCSGLGNLMFVYLLLRDKGAPREVMTNCLVNNTTNVTLILGLTGVLWRLDILPGAGKKVGAPRKVKKNASAETVRRLSRLSLLLTMAAVAFFTGAVWVLGKDGRLDTADGLVLIGLFLFWQCFQLFDVLKHNVRQKHSFGGMFYIDLINLIVGAALLYVSLDWLMNWVSSQKSGFLSAENLGWLSGWLMVLPNAILAFYYGWRSRADVVYSSQIGDAHICIPLCLGLFASFQPVPITAEFNASIAMLLGATALHFGFIMFLGRLPRWIAGGMVIAYAWYLYAGLVA